MSVLDPNIGKQELPFIGVMPDACLLDERDRRDTKLAGRNLNAPDRVFMAEGAKLVGLEITIWRCPYANTIPGYVMHTELIHEPHDRRWAHGYPFEDFFSSYQHMDEIIQRHTNCMLNLERLKNLNRICHNL